jgi:phosphopantothenate synthetase
MESVDYVMKVPKEGKDVVDLIDAILANVFAKTPISEWTNVIDELMAAVDGIQSVTEEMKSEGRDELAAYLVHKVMARVIPVKLEETAS